MLAAAALGAVALPLCASAAPSEVSSEWPQARLVGAATLRFIGLRIYDARLWAPEPLSANAWTDQAFALELQYARSFDGASIAERSLQEMQRQRPIDGATAERWLATMKATFPDVRAGDRVTGVHRPAAGARFFHDGTLKAEWPDSDITRHFFGIWLAPQTSEPALRAALLGGPR